MTEQSTPTSPKSKKSFWTILIVIAILFSIDHYQFHIISGGSKSTSDSSKVTTSDTSVRAVSTATTVPTKDDTVKK